MAETRPTAAEIVEAALRAPLDVDTFPTQRTPLRIQALEQAVRTLAARVDELELERRGADADG